MYSPDSPDCIMSAVEVLKPCVKNDLVLDPVCSTTSLGARAFTVSKLKTNYVDVRINA